MTPCRSDGPQGQGDELVQGSFAEFLVGLLAGPLRFSYVSVFIRLDELLPAEIYRMQQDADASACVGSDKPHPSKTDKILLVGENFGDLRYGVVRAMTSFRTTPRPESTAFHWRYVLPRCGNLISGPLKRKLATYVLKAGRI